MDNPKNIVPSEPEHHHIVILVFQGIAIFWMLFIILGLWYLAGFKDAFIAILLFLGIAIVVWESRNYAHHKHDIEDRKHLRALASRAIDNHHSVEFNPVTRSLRTISPLTVPNGPLTIKDVTFGQQAQIGEPLPVAPPFRDIEHLITPGHHFLGQGAQGPVWGSLTDLLSTLITGRPGQGKSTLLRDVCGQVLCVGGSPLVFDPHGSIVEDLGASFQYADDPATLALHSQVLVDQLNRRIEMFKSGQRTFKPLLLLADEVPLIVAMAPIVQRVIWRIISEGRKVSMFALLSGNDVSTEVFERSSVRDALSSRFIFRTTPTQARMAGLLAEDAKRFMSRLEQLGEQSTGRAILVTTKEAPQLVSIPQTTAHDIRRIITARKHSNVHEPPFQSSSNVVESDERLNDMNEPVKHDEYRMNIHEHDEYSGNIQTVSDEEKAAILAAAQTQFRMTGKVVRTKVRDDLGWNNAMFPKIKQVLDEENL